MQDLKSIQLSCRMQTGENADAHGCLQGSDKCKLRATIHKYRNIDLAEAQVEKSISLIFCL